MLISLKLRKEGETKDIEGNTVDIRMLPNGSKRNLH